MVRGVLTEICRHREHRCASPLRSGGWAGRNSEPASRITSAAPHQWWPQSWARRPLAASAECNTASRRPIRGDAYEEARPDAFCSRCSAWEHVTPHCKTSTADPKCSICAKDHAIADHRRPVEGCRAAKGCPCPQGETKCASCGGPHGARADAPLRGRTRPRSPRRRRRRRRARWRSRRGSSPPQRRWRSRGPRGDRKTCFVGVLFALFFLVSFFSWRI